MRPAMETGAAALRRLGGNGRSEQRAASRKSHQDLLHTLLLGKSCPVRERPDRR
jgi:hypothetical protein